jgi:hypothetical protein
VSWLGVKYALSCRDERVKGGTRLTFVAVGARVEYRRITTSPTSLGELRWLTLRSPEQIRRDLDHLETIRKVKRVRRGKNAIYALPEMAGPLFAVDNGDPVKMTDFVLENLPANIGHDARRVTGVRRRMTDLAGRRLLSITCTEEVAPSSDEKAASDFVDWFRAEYRRARGVDYQVKADAAERVARELLNGRTVDRLQAMARLMFEAERDRFIRDSDYSLFVLRHKASYLEGIIVADEGASEERKRDELRFCPHTPTCETRDACIDRQSVAYRNKAVG